MSDPITPAGMAALKSRYDHLFLQERPQMVETVSWAAGNGDRSENGDYIYGRKRLREIDRELAHLARRMKDLAVVDPTNQPDKTRIFFGATVKVIEVLENGDDREQTLTLVGRDEADASAGRIAWNSPVAQALKGARIGDTRTVRLPAGERVLEVLHVTYPVAASQQDSSSRT
jgi:transcription elongation factor GreB